jgi:hypothetical protein
LREIARDRSVAEESFVLFPVKEATQAQFRSVDGIRFTADAEFKGNNRMGGAGIIIYVKPKSKKESPLPAQETAEKGKSKKKSTPKAEPEKPAVTMADTTKKKEEVKDKDLLKLYVLNKEGDTMRYINQKGKEGWNFMSWDMKAKGVRFPSRNEPPKDDDDPSGAYVLPGEYKLVGIYNGLKDSTSIVVRLDPRLNITSADLEARNTMVGEYYKEVNLAQRAFSALQDVRKDVKMIEVMMVNAPDSTQSAIKDKTKELMNKLNDLEKMFMEPEGVKGYTNEINLGRYLSSAGSYLNTSLGDPGANARDMLSLTKEEVEKSVAAVNDFLAQDWSTYKNYVGGLNWPLFKNIEELK